MAERTVTVRLRALVDDYKRAMAGAAAATGTVETAAGKLSTIGRSTARLGDSLTRSVTLPLALAGAAAVKLASDFDAAFTKMTTLAGVGADEIDGLKESVLDLAGETGRAPQELAEALYFLQSSGLDSADAMEALEMSAKASAVGLGDTATVADAVSSAMLAYAESGLTAAEATDTLIATAKAGKAEPAELASQMGRLLPVASQLGISFQEVGGAVALLSRQGNDAAQSTTLLVNVMTKLLKPSQQAQDMLAKFGLSITDVQRMIEQDGLQQTLENLREASLGDNGFAKFMEDQQAVLGALSLTNASAEDVTEVMSALENSVGETDNAFGKWAESMGAKNARAFAELQVALIRIGESLAPIIADLAEFGSKILEAFDKLPQGAKTAVLAFAVVAAAIGPLLSIGGRLAMMASTVYSALVNMAVPAGSLSGAFGGASSSTGKFAGALGGVGKALGVVGGLIALREIAMALDDDLEGIDVSTLENELLDLAETGDFTGKQLSKIFDGFKSALESGDPQKLEAFSNQLGEVDKALAQLAARDPAAAASAFRLITDSLREQGASASQIKGFFNDYAAALAEADTASRTAAGGAGEAEGAMNELADATETATAKAQEYIDTLRAQFDPQFAMIDALQGSADAQKELRDSTAALNEARAGGDVDAIAEAEARYGEAVSGARRSVIDLHGAAVTLKASMEESGASAADVQAAFAALAKQQGFTEAETMVMAEAFGIATTKADELDAADANVAVTERGATPTKRQLESVTRSAQSTGRQRPNVNVRATDRASGILRNVRNLIFGIPTSRSFTFNARVTGLQELDPARALTGRQHGGPVLAGEAYVVGEAGPEVLLMGNQSGTIVPMAAEPAMAGGRVASAAELGAAGGPSGHFSLSIDLSGGDTQFMRWLRSRIREETGGNVQAALGANR